MTDSNPNPDPDPDMDTDTVTVTDPGPDPETDIDAGFLYGEIIDLKSDIDELRYLMEIIIAKYING